MASRPRAPGRGQTLGERIRGNQQQLVLGGLVAGAALVVAATLIALTLNARSASDNGGAAGAPPTSSTETTPPADPSGIVLPLGLTDVGIEGTITAVASDEGPNATSYCNNTPDTAGLIDWSGNRLTETGGRRRVVQLLARFRSSVEAAAYMTSNAAIVDCESWETAGQDAAVTFTIAELTPATIQGDETRQFELSATTDGPDLFLRVLLARSGRDVMQITYVSANRQDLDDTDRLLARAIETSGF